MEALLPEIVAVALFRFSASIAPSKERCAVIVAAFRRSGTQRNAFREGLRGLLLPTLPALLLRRSSSRSRFGFTLRLTLGFTLRSLALRSLALRRFTLSRRFTLGFALRRFTLSRLALRCLALGRTLRGLLGRFSLSFTFDRHGLSSE